MLLQTSGFASHAKPWTIHIGYAQFMITKPGTYNILMKRRKRRIKVHPRTRTPPATPADANPVVAPAVEGDPPPTSAMPN